MRKSAPKGAWEENPQILTDRPSKQQTDIRSHIEVSPPIISTSIKEDNNPSTYRAKSRISIITFFKEK